MTNFVFCFLINHAVTGFVSVLIISPYCLPVLLPRLTFDPKVFFFGGGGGGRAIFLPGKQSGGKLLITSCPRGNSAALFVSLPGINELRRRLCFPLVGLHITP